MVSADIRVEGRTASVAWLWLNHGYRTVTIFNVSSSGVSHYDIWEEEYLLTPASVFPLRSWVFMRLEYHPIDDAGSDPVAIIMAPPYIWNQTIVINM